MDDLRSKTDKTLAAMERRLTKIFAQAEKEIAEAWDAYMVSIADKIDVYEKEYQAAKESGDPDEKRRTGIRLAKAKQEQTLYNARYQAMVKQTAAKIADVNEIALDYINGQMPKVYAMNYNGTTQEIKADVAGASVNVGQYSFDLVDEATVKALILDDPNLVPQKYLNRMRDMGWNTKSINSQVLQGILQGESIPHIARRLENVVGMDANAAIRNARTMTTAAENNGRMESIKAAEAQGIVYKKTWMATHDARTRDAHADLDGVTVEIDDTFPNGLRYPGDPHGPASEIYNCRCSMVRKLVGFRRADGSISEVDVKGYEPTYFDDKPKTETPAPTEPTTKNTTAFESAKLKAVMGDKYDAFKAQVEQSESKGLYDKYADTTNYTLLSAKGSYNPGADTVSFSYETRHEGRDEFSTLSHESGHMFDAKMGRPNYLTYKEVDAINQKCVIGSGQTKILKAKPSTSDEFLTALRMDMDALKGSLRDGSLKKEMLATTALRNSTDGVQDALDGFFKTQRDGVLPWGHGERYYNRLYNGWVKGFGLEERLKQTYSELGMNVTSQAKAKDMFRHYEAASEAFANVNAALTVGGAELDAIKKYMPNTLKAYQDIVRKEIGR